MEILFSSSTRPPQDAALEFGSCLGLALFGAFVLCIPLTGQETLSTLRGAATDASGAVAPGVAITVEDVSTNITARKVNTDNQGNYEIPGLKEGPIA